MRHKSVSFRGGAELPYVVADPRDSDGYRCGLCAAGEALSGTKIHRFYLPHQLARDPPGMRWPTAWSRHAKKHHCRNDARSVRMFMGAKFSPGPFCKAACRRRRDYHAAEGPAATRKTARSGRRSRHSQSTAQKSEEKTADGVKRQAFKGFGM
jgi:hypothetical protein